MSDASGYSQSELQRINSAIKELLAPYVQHVSADTFTRFYRRLGEFPAKVAVDALNVADLFVRSRAPTPAEVMEIADQVQRHGIQSVTYAGRNWVRDLGTDDRNAVLNVLCSRGIQAAVAKAKEYLVSHGRLDNAPQPVALLEEDAATPSAETAARNRKVQELMQGGMGIASAHLVALGHDHLVDDVPGAPRKRHA